MCFGAGRYFFQRKKSISPNLAQSGFAKQEMKLNSFVWGKRGESNIFKKDNSDLLKSFTDRFKNVLGPKAENIIAEDNKSTREERQRLREAEKQLREKGRISADRQRANDEVQKLRNKIEQIPAKIDVFDEKRESELQRLKLLKKSSILF